MRQFHELFVGRDDAYGRYELPAKSVPEGQKVAGSFLTKREPVTKELYDKHLAGEEALGIVPIRVDSTVMWFAIDVDTYDNDRLHTDLLKKVEANALPLVMTKSKSGGAHLWCFLSEPMKAKDAKEVGEQYVLILQLPARTEVFPKQIEADKQNVGNWINLPYFGDTRKHVYLDGDMLVEAPLDLFISHANKAIVNPKDISHTYSTEDIEKVTKEGSDAPPCIDCLEANGVAEGGRDDTLFHVAVYLKKKYPEDWQERIHEWNSEHCQPPLPPTPVFRIAGQHQETDYGYKCEHPLMKSLCSKKLCMTRKFGIGGGIVDGMLPFRVNGIRKINSQIPIYYVSIDGKEIRMSLDDLCDYSRIKKLVVGVQDRNVPHVKQQVWDDALTTLLDTALVVEDAPSIVGETGMIIDMLHRFLEDFCQDEDVEQASDGRPYVDGEHAYFQGTDFLKFLRSEVQGVKHQNIWAALKEEAGATERTFTKKGGNYKLWVIPWRGKPDDGGMLF